MATVTVRMAARAAARRAMARAWLNGAAWWLLAAALIAMGMVLIGKRGVPVPDWPALVVAGVALSVLGGVLTAWRQRLSQARAARRLDAQLALKDRLGSALAFENASPPGPFQTLAVEDGERLAPQIRIGEAIRLRPHWTWYAGPGLLVSTVLAAMYIPAAATRPAQSDLRAERREAAESIRSASEAVLALAGTDPDDPVVAREIESVRQIEEELNSGASRPTEARADGARSLERIAERFEQRAGNAEELSQALRDALSRAARRANDDGAPGPGTAEPQQFNELADALKRGDLAAAQSAAAEAARRLEQMTPAERQAVADELRSLARAIDSAEPATLDGESTSADAAPRDPSGVQEESEPPATAVPPSATPTATPSQPSKSQEPAPAGSPAPDRPAGPPPAPQPPREQDPKRRQLEDLRRDLENAAREAESRNSQREQPGQPSGDQSQPPQREQPGQPGQQGPADRQPGDIPGTGQGQQGQPQSGAPTPRPASDSSQPKPPSSGPQDQPSGQPGSQPGRQPSSPGSPPAQSEPARPADGSPPQQGSPNAPGTPGPSQQPSPQPSSAAPGQSAPQPASGQGSKPSPGSSDQSQGETPGGPPSGTPPGGAPEPGATPGPDPGPGAGAGSAMEQLARRLGEAGRLAEQARRDKRTAQEMRRQAEELLNRATPEERQRLEELARQLATEQGAPPAGPESSAGEPGDGPGLGGRTRAGGEPGPAQPWDGEQTIDARPKVSPDELAGTPQREAARWSGDAPGRGEAAAVRGSTGERARQAARGLERAIEQQSVPGPYTDIVRRVQRRYAQRAAAAPTPSTSPSTVPDAPDVGTRPR